MSASEVRSVCPYCGVGCGIVMQVAEHKVVRVSGDRRHPANAGRLCTKGQTCAEVLTAPGRLDRAWLRSNRSAEPLPVPVDQAIAETGRRLRAVLDRDGPDAIAFYVSGQLSIEAQYLITKLAKGHVRSRHLESNSRLCMASAGVGYKQSLGADAPPGSYQDFDQTDLFFVIGANMVDCHPILFLRMMDRVKAGAKLIVVDPRRTATAEKADLFLQIRPGTDLALLNGLLHLLARNGRLDADFIAQFTEGWETMSALLADYPPARVAAITGLAEADLEKAADWIAAAPQWLSCWTMGLNQSVQGTWHTNALCNLHLATGAICRPGSGPFSLTGQPNAMGGREMGYLGAGLPGQRSALEAADRAWVERFWQLPAGTLRADAGEGTIGMFEEAAAGRIKACWIICTNPVASVANRSKVIDALQTAELVIAQDAFLDTETNRHADILLPAALWAEADGVMVNSERNLTLAPGVVAAPGEALPDWQIIARVAQAMGFREGFAHATAAEVFDEIRQLSNPTTGYDLRGTSHARLRETPLQWPCPPEGWADRHPIRYRNDGVSQTLRVAADGRVPRLAFPTASGRARFWPRPWLPSAERPDDDYPVVLNTGRLQHQWHTGTKTARVATLNRLNPGPFAEVHPGDADRFGLVEAGGGEIRSRRGRVLLPVRISERVQPGQCFVPFHWSDVFGEALAINALTDDAVDPVSLQPAFKYAAVALQPARVPQIDWPYPPAAVAAGGALKSAEPVGCDDETGQAAAITILWASQTGNAERFAARCADRFRAQGHRTALLDMAQCDAATLAGGGPRLLITSTFGDGDPPDNARRFWASLQGEPAPDLTGTAFAVLAFGDSNYAQFCGFGRRLDERLAELGATRLIARADCEPGADATADAWLASLGRALGWPVQEPGAAADPDALAGRDAPQPVRLIGNRLLSGAGAGKEVRQFVFDLADSGLSYQAGDALGVWPSHCPTVVDTLIAALGLVPQTPVSLAGLPTLSLSIALTRHLDIARVSPAVLRFVAERSGHPRLLELLQAGQEAARADWLHGRSLLDLVRMAPVTATADEWVAVLKRLQPRLYSIASSATANPREVHLTVSTVRYAVDGQARGGVCSTFLADRAAQEHVSVFVQPSAHFRPPQDTATDIIMVGPGTGIAPFRGFLQERRSTGARGRNWLFFGEQHAASDFYYRDELDEYLRDGWLHRLDTAFSRDQQQKVYVQDRMREQGAQLWDWLRNGACFYVCGDASRMARDVDSALVDIVGHHGGLAPAAAQEYVAALARDKRYLRDVY